MKLKAKLIQLDEQDKKILDKKADEQGMTTNQLIRILIKNYFSNSFFIYKN